MLQSVDWECRFCMPLCRTSPVPARQLALDSHRPLSPPAGHTRCLLRHRMHLVHLASRHEMCVETETAPTHRPGGDGGGCPQRPRALVALLCVSGRAPLASTRIVHDRRSPRPRPRDLTPGSREPLSKARAGGRQGGGSAADRCALTELGWMMGREEAHRDWVALVGSIRSSPPLTDTCSLCAAWARSSGPRATSTARTSPPPPARSSGTPSDSRTASSSSTDSQTLG
jgi:hypothetical protein